MAEQPKKKGFSRALILAAAVLAFFSLKNPFSSNSDTGLSEKKHESNPDDDRKYSLHKPTVEELSNLIGNDQSRQMAYGFIRDAISGAVAESSTNKPSIRNNSKELINHIAYHLSNGLLDDVAGCVRNVLEHYNEETGRDLNMEDMIRISPGYNYHDIQNVLKGIQFDDNWTLIFSGSSTNPHLQGLQDATFKNIKQYNAKPTKYNGLDNSIYNIGKNKNQSLEPKQPSQQRLDPDTGISGNVDDYSLIQYSNSKSYGIDKYNGTIVAIEFGTDNHSFSLKKYSADRDASFEEIFEKAKDQKNHDWKNTVKNLIKYNVAPIRYYSVQNIIQRGLSSEARAFILESIPELTNNNSQSNNIPNSDTKLIYNPTQAVKIKIPQVT